MGGVGSVTIYGDGKPPETHFAKPGYTLRVSCAKDRSEVKVEYIENKSQPQPVSPPQQEGKPTSLIRTQFDQRDVPPPGKQFFYHV